VAPQEVEHAGQKELGLVGVEVELALVTKRRLMGRWEENGL
jgi:hypothetical protein